MWFSIQFVGLKMTQICTTNQKRKYFTTSQIRAKHVHLEWTSEQWSQEIRPTSNFPPLHLPWVYHDQRKQQQQTAAADGTQTPKQRDFVALRLRARQRVPGPLEILASQGKSKTQHGGFHTWGLPPSPSIFMGSPIPKTTSYGGTTIYGNPMHGELTWFDHVRRFLKLVITKSPWVSIVIKGMGQHEYLLPLKLDTSLILAAYTYPSKDYTYPYWLITWWFN